MTKAKPDLGPITRLLEWADKNEMSQTDLAMAMGVGPQNIINWKRRGLPSDKHAEAARLMGLSLDAFVRGFPDVDVLRHAIYRKTLQLIPVRQISQLDGKGSWMLGPQLTDIPGYIELQSDDPAAFAIKIMGNDLHPRVKSGEYVIVSPSHPCNPGDEVLVTTTAGQQLVRELLFRRDGQVTLSGITNSDARHTLENAQIERMQYIAGFAKAALYRASKL
jgi:hypothetical protein